MEIRDVFILKNGVPIYHKKTPRSNLKRDETLTMGFLSALTSFAMEIGAGSPKVYATENARFSFHERDNFLHVIYTDEDITEVQVEAFVSNLSRLFLEIYEGVISEANFSFFDDHVSALLDNFYKTSKAPSEVKNEESRHVREMQSMVPKIYLDHEKLQLSENRRKLFKLIDGKNSIYEIAQQLDENPHKILTLLRSYKKEGRISF